MITMTTIADVHATQLRVSPAWPTCPTYGFSWKQRPSVLALGNSITDNSTGVSAVERRHR